MNNVTDDIPLRCEICRLPFAMIKGGAMEIQSHHHGEKHINVVPLVDVVAIQEWIIKHFQNKKD